MAEEIYVKRYRLILDFETWVNDEILTPYSDEDELDQDERQQLAAQRALLKAILDDKRGIYEELLRKRVLEEADFAINDDDWQERLLWRHRNASDEILLEKIIDELPQQAERVYLQEAIEDGTFKDVAGEAIFAFGVDLVGMALNEEEGKEEEF